MTIVTRHSEGLCGVCRRRDRGIATKANSKLIWVCDDPECLDIATRSGGMKQQDFDTLEAEAACVGAGDAMGAFLDEIGVTDMARMSHEQWAEMCKRGAAGYRAHLKKLVDENAIPF